MQSGLLCWFYAKIIDFSLLQLRFSFSSRKFVVKLASKSSKDVYFHFPATSESDFADANLDRQSRHAGIFFCRLTSRIFFLRLPSRKTWKRKCFALNRYLKCLVVFRDMAERKFGEARRDWHPIVASAFDLIANWRFVVWRHRFSPLAIIEPRVTLLWTTQYRHNPFTACTTSAFSGKLICSLLMRGAVR